MDTCDVLVVGGGPAGSSCAWRLRAAGLDVVVMDRAVFPRDKVCAGWITPQVVTDLELDLSDYARGRTLQAITGFRTGVIGRRRDAETAYHSPVSYGIRRCEFDHYLLQRSGARLALGAGVTSIRREGAHWVVNESFSASVLVGAGGHFCPVARWLNPPVERSPLVVAQEAEFRLDAAETAAWSVEPQMPELYFCRDLAGYGWCFRKGDYVNIGLGRLDRRALPTATTEFVAFLQARGKVPPGGSWRWKGHAYLIAEPPRRRVIGTGMLLIGDAAGLAYAESGEGIRPAIESGLLAASAIAEAVSRDTPDRLESYELRLRERFGLERRPRSLAGAVSSVAPAVLPWLLRSPWFVRNLILNRWFLHAHDPAITLAPSQGILSTG
jgi:geranylgeranyl reductase family protein